VKTESSNYRHRAETYAARYRVDRATVFRWMRAFAPLDDAKRMRLFIASRKNMPRSFQTA
jgi:hypothetical protein